MKACPQCGKQNEADARFCSACGTAFPQLEARGDVRKTVTVVFCDVIGSTQLGERLDPEATRKLMARYFDTARTVLERHGGTVEKFIGDAVMAVFGMPQVHEDDALRAVRAAAELRDTSELEVRIGVNTGEVVSGTGDTLVTGDAVNVAARLEQAAAPGEILIGERTRSLTAFAIESAPVEDLQLKGKAEPVAAHRLLGVLEGAPGFPRRLDSPLVGRERELAQLRQAYERAAEDRTCHLVTILGPAGIGKSRLAGELPATVRREPQLLTGRCLPYGEGITYWPVVEVVQQLGGAEGVRAALAGTDAAADQVLALVGESEATGSSEEAFWSVRNLLEALARQQPLVLVLDDLHWAEPTFLDLVEHIADWSRDAPILMLCLARPELLDARPAWGGGKLNATSLLLEPLSDEETETLIGNLPAGRELSDDARRRIEEAAEGNPLFVEQMLAMLAEEDAASKELVIPPTIEALLAARLDRLPEKERAALQRAAIVGKEFWRSAVVDLGGEADALPALVRKELIRPHASTMFTADDPFRFRHLLIRDVAYETLPKELRADLHERFAAWLESRSDEYDEITGYHLEQAHRYRVELDLRDEKTDRLAADAAERLTAAGRRALYGGDASAAVNLLRRADRLLPETAQARLDLVPDLAAALRVAGEIHAAIELLGTATEIAESLGDRRRAMHAAVERMHLLGWADPDVRPEQLLEVAERARPVFEESGDDVGLARAWRLVAMAHHMRTTWSAMVEPLQRGLEHARRAGDRRFELDLASYLCACLYWGPTPVDEALTYYESLLQEDAPPVMQARLHRLIGGCLAMQGRIAEAREECERGHRIFEGLGTPIYAAQRGFFGGPLELLAGDPAAAERELRPAVEIMERHGETSWLSSLAAFLSEALYQQDKFEEAESYAELAEQTASRDDLNPHALSGSVRAKILARRGRFDEAERLAREAVDVIRRGDEIVHEAHVLVDLGEVLRLAGRPREAADAVEQAVTLYRRKGNLLAAKHAEGLLAELATEPVAKRD